MMKTKPITRRSAITGIGVMMSALMVAGRKPTLARSNPPDDGGNARSVVKLGLLTDVHYADKPPLGSRYYRDSLPKLEVALQTFADEQVNAIIQLGDLADAHATAIDEEKALRDLARRFNQVDIPYHFVLGNHCLERFSKRQFSEITGCRHGYYSVDIGSLRIVILDANYRADETSYDSGNFVWTDCHLPRAELDWLDTTLRASNKPTIIFTHQRLDPDPYHTVDNHESVRRVIADAGAQCVKAVFQGHFHENHLFVSENIPYVVLRGMIEGPTLANNAFAILHQFEDGSLSLDGYGQQNCLRRGLTSAEIALGTA